jgi:hypothetical protein
MELYLDWIMLVTNDCFFLITTKGLIENDVLFVNSDRVCEINNIYDNLKSCNLQTSNNTHVLNVDYDPCTPKKSEIFIIIRK